jgi:hypothetical protein
MNVYIHAKVEELTATQNSFRGARSEAKAMEQAKAMSLDMAIYSGEQMNRSMFFTKWSLFVSY